jgi:hypothetical protein
LYCFIIFFLVIIIIILSLLSFDTLPSPLLPTHRHYALQYPSQITLPPVARHPSP